MTLARTFRYTRLALLSIVAMIITACGSSNGGSGLAKNQTLTLPSETTDYASLDPAQAYDLYSYQAAAMMYSGLLYLDHDTLAVKADIATEVPSLANGDISADGLTYTFHLKSDIKFSNGDPVTARTFAYSIDRTLQPKLKSQYPLTYLGAILGASDLNYGKIPTIIGTGKGLEVVDPTTLKIRLAPPGIASSLFLNQLTFPLAFAVDERIAAANPLSPSYDPIWTDHAVGTGPFELQSWIHKSQAVFVPNPYWYGPKLTLTKVIRPFAPSPDSSYKAYKNGQYDVSDVTGADIPDAQHLKPSQYSNSPTLSVDYIAPNWNVPPFDDQKVRQAFAETVDRDTINRVVSDNANIAAQNIVPKGMSGYDSNLKGLPFDPTGAKALLAQSKYGADVSKYPTVTLTYPSDYVTTTKAATQLAGDWKSYLGIDVKLQGVDLNTLYTKILPTQTCQLFILGWIADYPDPQDFTSLQFTHAALMNGTNYTNVTDPHLDQLLGQADTEQDTTTRYQLYNQAEELAIRDVTWMVYDQQTTSRVVKSYVKGYAPNAARFLGSYDWENIQIMSH
jgi:oligopeptide transport system substrate-binding protein